MRSDFSGGGGGRRWDREPTWPSIGPFNEYLMAVQSIAGPREPSERVGRVRRRKVDSVGFQHIPFIRWMVTSLLESGLPIESGPKARAQCCALIMWSPIRAISIVAILPANFDLASTFKFKSWHPFPIHYPKTFALSYLLQSADTIIS